MATTSGSKLPKRQKIRDWILELSATAETNGHTANGLLAVVVQNEQCSVWIGKHRAQDSPSTIAYMLRTPGLVRHDGTLKADNCIISYVDRGGTLKPVPMLDAELTTAEVRKGLESLGIDPPASLGGITKEARAAGGKKKKYDRLIQQLLNHAAQELADEGLAVKLITVLARLNMLSPEQRRTLGIQSIVARGDSIKATDTDGDPHQEHGSTLRRYFTRAKESIR